MFLDNFSARLKEERTKLNLSQTEFAEACGVKKLSQFKYENGERYPDAMYLINAMQIGVDVLYVLSGQRLITSPKADNAEDAFILSKLKEATAETKKQILLLLIGAPIATSSVVQNKINDGNLHQNNAINQTINDAKPSESQNINGGVRITAKGNKAQAGFNINNGD